MVSPMTVGQRTIAQTSYKKRLVYRINKSLLLKIILYNTWTLQLTNFN